MIEGGCRCGAVRYAIARNDLPPSYACHCHQCQRWTGGPFSQSVIVPEETLAITGPVVTFERVTEDRVSTQRACGECLSRLYNTNTRRPGFAVVRAGTLDRSEELACVGHIFVSSQQRWFELPEGVPTWPEWAPPAEFAALLAGER